MSKFNRGGLTPRRLSQAIRLLEESLINRMSLSAISQECGLSPGYFARAFKVSTGVSPYKWLAEYRIEKAMQMMTSSPLSLGEISAFCGFADQAYFARSFRKTKGVPPCTWRRGQFANEPNDDRPEAGALPDLPNVDQNRKIA